MSTNKERLAEFQAMNQDPELVRVTLEWQGHSMTTSIRVVRTGDLDFDRQCEQTIGHVAEKMARQMDRTRRKIAEAG